MPGGSVLFVRLAAIAPRPQARLLPVLLENAGAALFGDQWNPVSGAGGAVPKSEVETKIKTRVMYSLQAHVGGFPKDNHG